jgi:hypothetical protein
METMMNQNERSTAEKKFAQNSLEEINAHGRRTISATTWTITALEIDFGEELDSGGLYVFEFAPICTRSSLRSGVVRRAIWHRSPVAVKSFRMDGVKASVSDREVNTSKPKDHLIMLT